MTTWTHSDPRTIPGAFAAAVVRGNSGVWASDSASVADLRALIAGTAGVRAAALHGPIPNASRPVIEIVDLPTISKESIDALVRAAMVSALDNTWLVLVGRAPSSLASFSTDGGGPPVDASSQTAGAIPAVVLIVGVAGVAMVYMFCAQKAAEVIDRKIARDQSGKQLLQEHTKMLELIGAHHQAEQLAGRDIPFNDAERQALATLSETQRIFALKAGEPIPSPLPDAGAFTTSAAFPLVLSLAIAGGLFFAFKKERR